MSYTRRFVQSWNLKSYGLSVIADNGIGGFVFPVFIEIGNAFPAFTSIKLINRLVD